MNARKKLMVANWKTYKSHIESIKWVEYHKNDLNEAATRHKTELVICPTFTALAPLQKLLTSTTIKWGAQNCSAFPGGAHTGDVTARSLGELDCAYCIIGHSERRAMHPQVEELIANKARELWAHAITPIICFGERQQTHSTHHIIETLHQQLEPIITAQANNPTAPLCIAYEPAWAIGSDTMPQPAVIQNLCAFIHKLIPTAIIIYGGSVDAHDIEPLKTIPELDGFLIGRASTDFASLLALLDMQTHHQ